MAWKAAHDVLVEFIRTEEGFTPGDSDFRLLPVEEVVQYLESKFFEAWGPESAA